MLKGGQTRIHKTLRDLEKLGIQIIPPELPDHLKNEPEPALGQRYPSALATEIARSVPLEPLHPARTTRKTRKPLEAPETPQKGRKRQEFQSLCPFCRAQGFSLVIKGEKWYCLSPPCQRGDVYTPHLRAAPSVNNVGPISGGIDRWRELRAMFPRHFTNLPSHAMSRYLAAEIKKLPLGPRDEPGEGGKRGVGVGGSGAFDTPKKVLPLGRKPSGEICAEWLRGFLTEEKSSGEIVAAAKKVGFATKALYQAKKLLGISVRREPNVVRSPKSLWSLK